MNTISRICVVFVAAASLCFAAFAGALRNGGPNWLAEADALRQEFVFETIAGDVPRYKATHRRTGQAVGRESTVLAEVVVAANQKYVSDLQEEQRRLSTAAAEFPPKKDEALKSVADDEQGLQVRETDLNKQLQSVRDEIEQANGEIIEKANAAQQIRLEGQERREEGYRLRNQLELLRNDLYAAQTQRKDLEDEQVRLTELLRRLERRNRSLQGDSEIR